MSALCCRAGTYSRSGLKVNGKQRQAGQKKTFFPWVALRKLYAESWKCWPCVFPSVMPGLFWREGAPPGVTFFWLRELKLAFAGLS